MQYWYFNFEGRFAPSSHIYPGKGLFSSCLVPEENYARAKRLFLEGLKANQIKLVDTVEKFLVDGDNLDPDDPRNPFWIEWYNRAKARQEPIFDVWHVYDE